MDAGIRKIELQDGQELLQLLSLQMAAYVKEAEMIGLPDIPPLFESPETIRSSGETFYGYYPDVSAQPGHGSGPLGAVSVRREEEGLRICRLMVRPECFRRGIASRLLRYVLEHTDGGAGSVTVRTVTSNTAAWALYARHGFRPTGRETAVNGLVLAELAVRPPARPDQTGTE